MDHRVDFLPPAKRKLSWAGYLLGFSIGGFFDGILLHQILQWHHLLSGLQRAPFTDIRIQILADGAFHAVMYLIAGVGLWKLLQSRYLLVDKTSDRLLAGAGLLGFGAWHILDGILSHWVLGLHRIRMDVPNPLFWDLLWFGVFGVLFVVLGIAVRRSGKPPTFHGKERRRKARSILAPLLLITMVAGAIGSALPPADAGDMRTVTVILRPDASPAQLLAGLRDIDARIVWHSGKGDVWVLAMNEQASRFGLFRHGAMFVSGTSLPAGCSAWMRNTI